jgi:hypothetical protein
MGEEEKQGGQDFFLGGQVLPGGSILAPQATQVLNQTFSIVDIGTPPEGTCLCPAGLSVYKTPNSPFDLLFSHATALSITILFLSSSSSSSSLNGVVLVGISMTFR